MAATYVIRSNHLREVVDANQTCLKCGFRCFVFERAYIVSTPQYRNETKCLALQTGLFGVFAHLILFRSGWADFIFILTTGNWSGL